MYKIKKTIKYSPPYLDKQHELIYSGGAEMTKEMMRETKK